MMESKRKRPKGGFFNLFDWNRKPKKLFAYDTDSPVGNQGITKPLLQKVNERKQNSPSSEFSCASSVYSDEGSCSRPPSVVAKLMGLDSMPLFNTDEPSSRSFNLQSPGSSRYYWSHPYLSSQCSPLAQGVPDGYVWNSIDRRRNKVQEKPNERSQNDILQSKSLKTFSVTHHSTASPIKSPGYATRKGSCATEITAKTVKDYQREIHSKVSSTQNRTWNLKQTVGSPSRLTGRPLAACTPVKKRAPQAKCNGSENMRSNGILRSLQNNSADIVRKNGVSSPSSINAYERRREGSTMNRIGLKSRKQDGSQSFTDCRRSPPNKCSVASETAKCANPALKQNDRKQNGLLNKNDSSLCKVKSIQQVEKLQMVSTSIVSARSTKIVRKPGIRTRKATVGPGEQKASTSSEENSIKSYSTSDKSASEIVSFNNNEMKFAYNGAKDCPRRSLKTSMDVVSFTFSSPIKAKSDLIGKSQWCDDQISTLDSGVDPDAVSSFLEHKLKELTQKVQLSNINIINLNSCKSTVANTQKLTPVLPVYPRMTSQIRSDLQHETEDMELHGNHEHRTGCHQGLDCLDPSPLLINETLWNDGKCPNMHGVRKCFWNQGTGVAQHAGAKKISESTSISMSNVVISHKTDTISPSGESSGGIINYLRRILLNADAMLDEFIIGGTSKVVEPNIFDLLESQDNKSGISGTEFCELGRKLLFDCASECLDLMCEQASFGEPKALARLWTLFQKEGLAAESVYKEILYWRNMEHLMVDEVIDKDMTSQYGKWTDFKVEALEEGLRIDSGILTSLLDEIVSDLLPS